MFSVFECIALAIKNKGIRGLCEMVPGGSYVLDIAGEAYRLFRERKRDKALRDELAQIAAANSEQVKQTAAEVAREVANSAPVEERIALELYLTQVPGAVRQSLKRAEDPSGKTVPADFAVDSPEDLAKMLPARAPQFRPGNDLPGRPGWTLEELLGAGGFGEVWLVRHTFIPHPRAVKFCTDTKVRAKLTSHEGRVIARVMAQGSHPNVVPLLDAVLDGQTPWLMYEYLGGGNLTDLIHRWQPLTGREREAIAIGSLTQLALAVDTFHRLAPPIVHRDLKPANILLVGDSRFASGDRRQETGDSKQPGLSSLSTVLKITDFGIGGVAVDYLRTQPPGLSLMTGWLETSLRGSYTPLYASPQQARGSAPDPRDDVHALGVIGFQILTGKLSEAPGTRFERELRRRGVSDGFIDLIGDCVDTEPNGRPKNASDLAERLGKLKKDRPTPPTPLPAGRGEKNTQASESPRVSASATSSPLPAGGEGRGGVGQENSLKGGRGPNDSPAPTVLEGGSHGLKPTAAQPAPVADA